MHDWVNTYGEWLIALIAVLIFITTVFLLYRAFRRSDQPYRRRHMKRGGGDGIYADGTMGWFVADSWGGFFSGNDSGCDAGSGWSWGDAGSGGDGGGGDGGGGE